MSENIFSNFYNKVLSFFQKDKEDNSESAKDTATNRLKLVLMQDRSNLDGATMQKMREQLICVISKYIEIDQEALDLNLEADGDEIALMLNIPVIRARTREEIEELEKQEMLEQEKAKEKSDSENDENSEECDENEQDSSTESDNSEQDEEENKTEESQEAENNENVEDSKESQEAETSTEESDNNTDSDEEKKTKKTKNK